MSGLRLTPTGEQQVILETVRSGTDIKIQALAGTGKTSTLRMIAASKPDARGQYVAFNKAIVTDAQSSFPPKVTCSTAHSLAYRDVGARYRHRLKAPRLSNLEVAGWLRCKPFAAQRDQKPFVITDDQVARSALATVQGFCRTADLVLAAAHVPPHPLVGEAKGLANAFAGHVLEYARLLWQDIERLDGVGHFSHDSYLKLWQLSSPVIRADYIMFDEAQDADPVMLAVIKAQQHAQLVYCGDEFQTLYEWRGATNALEHAGTDRTLWLTQSFRFGPQIATWANGFLRRLDAPKRLRGLDAKVSRVGVVDSPDAILCRTNAGVFDALLDCMDRRRRAAVVGGVGDLTVFARACASLQQGRRADHPDLAPFRTWAQVMAWIEENPEQAPDIAQKVKLVDRHGAEKIERLLKEVVPEASAEVTISTVHQAKGREWPTVRLADDFPHPDDMDEAQLRIGYVAVTRARGALDVGQLLERASRDAPRASAEPTANRDAAPKARVSTARRPSSGRASRPLAVDRPSVAPSPADRSIVAGARVRHDRMGEGTVLSVNGCGDSAWYLIRFADGREHSMPAWALH